MLYSIIPPILIVLSLTAIIAFLIKKADKEAPIKNWESTEASESKRGDYRKSKQKILIILERVTRRSKVVFLKLENLFTGWSESIRKCRKKAEEKDGYQSNKNEKNRSEKMNYISVLKENTAKDAEKDVSKVGRTFVREEKTIKPMISEKVVEPRNLKTKKNLFENILIERIAANPKDIEAYERLGEYYIEIENWRYAKECFKQVMKFNPRNSGARMKMRKLEQLLSK